VNTVRGILKQEQTVFGEIARARQNYAGAKTLPDKAAASQTIDSALARLLVIVENYPQLKSSQNVQDLMTELEGTENRITQGRRDYNGIATSYNVNIKQFPRNIIAGLFGFHAKQLFQANVESRQAPNVNLDVSTSPSP
jgi:LemA protein